MSLPMMSSGFSAVPVRPLFAEIFLQEGPIFPCHMQLQKIYSRRYSNRTDNQLSCIFITFIYLNILFLDWIIFSFVSKLFS